MGSGASRLYELNDLNDLPGIDMMLAASLFLTANDTLVKQALGAAGSAELLFYQGLFALLALLIYAAINR